MHSSASAPAGPFTSSSVRNCAASCPACARAWCRCRNAPRGPHGQPLGQGAVLFSGYPWEPRRRLGPAHHAIVLAQGLTAVKGASTRAVLRECRTDGADKTYQGEAHSRESDHAVTHSALGSLGYRASRRRVVGQLHRSAALCSSGQAGAQYRSVQMLCMLSPSAVRRAAHDHFGWSHVCNLHAPIDLPDGAVCTPTGPSCACRS
jgi:hypothetical protein